MRHLVWAVLFLLPLLLLAPSGQAQQVKPKSASEIINDAYSLILSRSATPVERQYWSDRLSKISPIAVTDLYDGLTRLPDFRKRFAGLPPKAQVALMYRTLLRKNSVDAASEATWLAYLQKNGLQGTIEGIVSSVDRTMDVYKAAGLSTQQEADAVHVAEDTAQSDRPKAVALYKLITRSTRVPAPFYYLARVQEATDPKAAIETLRLETAKFPDDCVAELRLARLMYDHGVQGVAFQRARNGMHVSDVRIGVDSIVTNMKDRLAQAKHIENLSRGMLINRIQVHQRADQYPAVFAEVERAMAFGPGDGMVYLYRGDAFYNTRKYEEAIKDLNVAEKYIGKSMELLWARGLSYSELGRWQLALDDLNILIPMAPFPRFYTIRAKCYGALGKRKQQIDDLNHVIAVEPRNAKPLIARGRAYLAMGSTKDALADANKAISISRRYREGYKFRGEVYMKMNKKVAAAADFKTVEQLSKLFDETREF